MQTVRCKMQCQRVVKESWGHGDQYEYQFSPVYDDGCKENKTFWEATPNGSLNLSCTSVKDAFIAGKMYYIDIKIAE